MRADSNEPETISLLRTEAEQRAATVSVSSMRVELDLGSAAGPEPGETFGSTATIDFRATVGAATFVDFKGRRLISATLNGAEVPADRWRGGRIELTGLREENTLVVAGEMAYSSDGEGLHRHVDPADGNTYLYAMSFLDAAPRWFACFDQPDLKAPYTLAVTAPEDWTVVGNGPSRPQGPGRWEIVQDRPLSTYFVTLVAGPYASVFHEYTADGQEPIRLGFHVRASLGAELQDEAADLIEVTSQCFDYYHRTFGIQYPFGEYHQCFVPDFNAGAMENPGCITIRDRLIYRSRATTAERASRAGLIAHEMAHQWFGDLVTMTWWDDLWLNESFAEYAAHRCCTEATNYPLWIEFGVRKDWGRVADQSPSTHPVAGNGSADAQAALQDFDGISYAKGAAVLRQLVAYLGDEVFLSGLKDYFDRHAYANASFADLIAAWTRAGADGLDDWARGWLRTSGLDTISVDGDTVRRAVPADHVADRTHAIEVAGIDTAGTVSGRKRIRLAAEPVAVTVAEADVIIPDSADETWAKIRFGERAWPSIIALIDKITDPTVRLVIFSAARDAVRDAELDPADALRLILTGAPSEPEDIVWQSMITFARTELAGPYCPPAERSARLAEVHGRGGDRADHRAGRIGSPVAGVPGRRGQCRRPGAAPVLAVRRRAAGRGRPRPGPPLGDRRPAERADRRCRADRGRVGRRPLRLGRAARRPGPGRAADAGGQGGRLAAADAAVHGLGLSGVLDRGGILPAGPDRTHRRLRRTLLRRGRRNRRFPHRLGPRPGRLPGLSVPVGDRGDARTGRADPGRTDPRRPDPEIPGGRHRPAPAGRTLTARIRLISITALLVTILLRV